MASKALLRLSRRSSISLLNQPTALSVATPTAQGYHNGQNHQQHGGSGRATAAAGAAVFAFGAAGIFLNKELKAESVCEATQEVLAQENRIRQFSKPERIFDYFASFVVTNKKGKNVTLMSVSDFYNAVTPGSTLTHGSGRGVYTVLQEDEVTSNTLYENEKISCITDQNSVLNKIQKGGLLTYIDFIFLTHILATPRRYMDIAFHAFDVSADGDIEAKEFIHVMAKIVNYKGNPDDLNNETHSGLVDYLFGADRSKSLKKEDFDNLQKNLMDEMLFIEYGRYDKKNENAISALDFSKHILYNSNLSDKKKAKMLKRVEKAFKKDTNKITFEMYRDFYYLLFGGSDLERAMFFLDTESEREGVNREEFSGIAKWVAGKEINDYIIEVLFTLLDEDGDMNLSVKEFVPVMFQWRNNRGFQKSCVQVTLGQLRI
jgi:Ca2+-binding EF-hand superfamily protein